MGETGDGCASMGAKKESLVDSWLRQATSNGVPRRSLLVALVVGSILNVINQWDGLFGDATLDLLQLCLNYVVPYLVATYGAVSMRRSTARSHPAED